jgi:hypothetical protein
MPSGAETRGPTGHPSGFVAPHANNMLPHCSAPVSREWHASGHMTASAPEYASPFGSVSCRFQQCKSSLQHIHARFIASQRVGSAWAFADLAEVDAERALGAVGRGHEEFIDARWNVVRIYLDFGHPAALRPVPSNRRHLHGLGTNSSH